MTGEFEHEFGYGLEDPEAIIEPGEADTPSEEDLSFWAETIDVDFEDMPFMLTKTTERARRLLESFGLEDVNKLDEERLVELARALSASPEELDRVPIMLEDLFFIIQALDCRSKNLGDPITTTDLSELAETINVERYQEAQTARAYEDLSRFVDDPIMDVPHLEQLKKERAKMSRTEPTSWQEYQEKEAQLQEIDAQIKELAHLTRIEEIKERRDRAIRRMSWLLNQDFMVEVKRGLLQNAKKDNQKVSFQELVNTVAGYEDLLAEHHPGVVDTLLDEHRAHGAFQDDWTEKHRRRHALKEDRLTQARCVCQEVFVQDTHDRIYEVTAILDSQFSVLQFFRQRLYSFQDPTPVKDFVTFLPGGVSRDTAEYLAREELPILSGRSKVQLFADIDQIIDNSESLGEQDIESLVKKAATAELSSEEQLEIASCSLDILEALLFRYGYAIDKLLAAAE